MNDKSYKEDKKDVSEETNKTKVVENLVTSYWSNFDALDSTFDRYDDYEAILLGQPKDKMSRRTKNRISDSLLTTLAIEGTARTIAVLPSGTTKAASMKDKGYAMILDITRQRYVYPNANKQHPLDTKFRLWDFYKRVYGYAAMQYDWVVRGDYIGPDCWLIHPRNLITQKGKISDKEWDYVDVDTWVTLPTLKKWLADPNSKYDKEELQELIDWVENGKPVAVKDERQRSWIERDRNQDGRQSSGSVKLTTRYEAGKNGHWITYCPTYGCIIRDIKNPHDNGKIPIKVNYSYPLLDTMQALGDFERGKSLQFARDGITNSFALGFNMSILPPAIINPNGVVPSTIKYLPNQIWHETQPNSIRRFEVNPQSISTYQNAYNVLTGMQYNQAGSTDTRLTQDGTSDPGFGRSPAAISKQEKRENSRDNWNRALTEAAMEELIHEMMCLFSTRQRAAIIINLFDEEIELVKGMGYKGLDKMIEVNDTKNYAKLTVPNNFFKDISYRFYIDADSTQKEDLEGQREAMSEIIQAFNKVPQLNEMLTQQGYTFDIGAAMYRWVVLTGVDNPEQIVRQTSEKEMMMQQTVAQQQQMIEQLQAKMQEMQAQMQMGAGMPGATMQNPEAQNAMNAVLSRFNG